MAIVRKFMELRNPSPGYYSHEDQNVHGLRFSVFYSDKNVACYLIKGEEDAVNNYIARFGADITELKRNEMQSRMDTQRAVRTDICPECGGTGQITVPGFNADEAIKGLD